MLVCAKPWIWAWVAAELLIGPALPHHIIKARSLSLLQLAHAMLRLARGQLSSSCFHVHWTRLPVPFSSTEASSTVLPSGGVGPPLLRAAAGKRWGQLFRIPWPGMGQQLCIDLGHLWLLQMAAQTRDVFMFFSGKMNHRHWQTPADGWPWTQTWPSAAAQAEISPWRDWYLMTDYACPPSHLQFYLFSWCSKFSASFSVLSAYHALVYHSGSYWRKATR